MIDRVRLIVTRGLPASGKTTWAKEWVAKDVRHRARVERDALRAMMHDSVWKGRHTEDQIVLVEKQIVSTLLLEGYSVVVSDTNLDPQVFKDWQDFALTHGVLFEMQDFRNVPLTVCLKRNAKRTGKEFIPETAIFRMYNQFVKGPNDPELKVGDV